MAMGKKEVREQIIKFLRKKRGSFFKQRTIFKRIKPKEVAYSEFKKLLRDLSKEGRIERGRKNTYRFPDVSKNVVGTITLKNKGFGFVKTDSGEEIFIGGYDILNSFDGDTVLVQKYSRQRGKLPEGKVVKILKRANRPFFGTLKRRGKRWYLIPEEPEHPVEILLVNSIEGMEEGKIAEVRDLVWDDPGDLPEGQIVKIVGDFTDPVKDIEIVKRMFNLPDKFPPRVLREVDNVKEPDIEKELAYREDLRGKDIFTIDPIDARDFDDAVSLELDKDGNYVLGVHISDVSYFVRPGMHLDREALKRGLSVYFAEAVIPMLPEKLSGELCSLRPNEDKLTYSVEMKLDRQGNLLDYRIFQSVIRSKRRFTYEEVQDILDSGKGDFYEVLAKMRELSRILYEKRRTYGSIDFDIPEPVFTMDVDGIPLDIRPSIRLDSHRLIEEFMLAANKTVAEHIAVVRKKEKLPFIYRVHEKPSEESVNGLYNILKRFGLNFTKPEEFKPSDLQMILEYVEDFPFKNFVEMVSLRSMAKAKYSTRTLGHFGLAFKYYTHFTSPIRRYPDLVVHRLLKYYDREIKKDELKNIRRGLRKIAKKSSENELKALEAEREYTKIKQVRFLKDKIGVRYKGIISGVVEYGFFVEISDFLVDGFVHVRNLYDDYYVYDGQEHMIVGRRYGSFSPTEHIVDVVIKDVSVEERRVDLELAE